MRRIENLTYGCREENRLDLYLPDGESFDLFIYFHGGGLTGGSKQGNCEIFHQLAEAGVAAASVEYRKYPHARYPDFIEDSAAAVAWLKSSIGRYGCCKRIYIGGSSAGGYLSMMLCFDARWLGAHGLRAMDFAGFIHDAGQPTKHFNVLKEQGLDSRRVIIDETAPLYHVGAEEYYPPMLFIVSDNDMQNRLEQTNLMLATLRHFGHEAECKLCHGKHVHYLKQQDAQGRNAFAAMVLEFLK